MTTFAPSKHSYGLVGYGDPVEVRMADDKAARAASTGTAAKASTGEGIIAGTFHDAENYSYTVSSTSIVIYKKNGAIWKTITPSSSEWDTVVRNLVKDTRTGKLTGGMAVPQVSSGGGGGSSAPDPGPDLAQEDPFYKKTWFPVAVVGGLVGIGLLTYALWPSKA